MSRELEFAMNDVRNTATPAAFLSPTWQKSLAVVVAHLVDRERPQLFAERDAAIHELGDLRQINETLRKDVEHWKREAHAYEQDSTAYRRAHANALRRAGIIAKKLRAWGQGRLDLNALATELEQE